MYYGRTLSKKVKEASRSFKVVLVTGPRQVGKTTLLKRISEEIDDGGRKRTVVSLDDNRVLALARRDPYIFFQTYKPPLLIDEIQRAPELFVYIKTIVDNTDERGLFWLTGSQKFTLMKNVSDSLAGRVAILELQGLSGSERSYDCDRESFIPELELMTKRPVWTAQETFMEIFKGSYPQLFDEHTDRDLYFRSYVDTYLMRDVRDIVQIGDELNFSRFLSLLAVRTSQVINYESIARDAEISPNTAKSWINILETLGIVYRLPSYFADNIGKRLIKAPKLYFWDTGLCSYLCSLKTPEMLMESYLSEAFIETYAVSEIAKSYIHNGSRPNIYYCRTGNQEEIDLIIEEDNKVYPVEIKKTATPTLSMAKNFKLLDSDKMRLQKGVGCILCLCERFMPMKRDLYMIPLSYI